MRSNASESIVCAPFILGIVWYNGWLCLWKRQTSKLRDERQGSTNRRGNLRSSETVTAVVLDFFRICTLYYVSSMRCLWEERENGLGWRSRRRACSSSFAGLLLWVHARVKHQRPYYVAGRIVLHVFSSRTLFFYIFNWFCCTWKTTEVYTHNLLPQSVLNMDGNSHFVSTFLMCRRNSSWCSTVYMYVYNCNTGLSA